MTRMDPADLKSPSETYHTTHYQTTVAHSHLAHGENPVFQQGLNKCILRRYYRAILLNAWTFTSATHAC
eukprot:scaffold412838_cov15-Prasinocladus_malaysianus.AAC.1